MPPWVFVSVIGLAAFVVASFFILMFFAALLEKHPLARFTPADFAELPEPSPYFLAVNESARKLGFEFLGAYKQKRQTAVYGAYFAAWLSPDNKTVLRIVGGKTIKVTEKKMILISYLLDNHIVSTGDTFGTPGLSGLTDSLVLLHAHLEELYPIHQQRLAAKTQPARPFEKDRAIDVIVSLGEMTATRLVEMGLARFTTPEKTVWSYTIKGSLLLCSRLPGQFSKSNRQLERTKLKRPGDT